MESQPKRQLSPGTRNRASRLLVNHSNRASSTRVVGLEGVRSDMALVAARARDDPDGVNDSGDIAEHGQ